MSVETIDLNEYFLMMEVILRGESSLSASS